jgi:hypothetical protein
MPNESEAQSAAFSSPVTQLRELIRGYQLTQLIYVAAKLGIADLLRGGPKTTDQLAASSGTNTRNLYRVLRALASNGIFSESGDGLFELTPLAEPLQTGVLDSLSGWAIISGGEWHRAWGDLVHNVVTGETAFDHEFEMGYWEYLAQNPQADEAFNQAMTDSNAMMLAAVVDAYNFDEIETIVDIGGGQGSLITAILKANPTIRGVLFDQPNVIASAGRTFQQEGVAGRCDLVGGDFFQGLPENGDAYVLQRIIHDWDDEHAIAILRSCRRAMAGDAKLLVVESVIPTGNEPSAGKLSDIMMIVLVDGVERTESEFRILFDAAGSD